MSRILFFTVIFLFELVICKVFSPLNIPMELKLCDKFGMLTLCMHVHVHVHADCKQQL